MGLIYIIMYDFTNKLLKDKFPIILFTQQTFENFQFQSFIIMIFFYLFNLI